ncbi:XdhC family protein [Microbacterium sp. cf332]|uniref:XdhC family protein n=1 Tax=Microbacterium sp. cf332 TaxID=1761804 RepID=UPI0008873936|nr:XdhC family protein [Microbacterium sp. cf332]SDQ61018.1 xanthine dehydrogenase accessory factor [Microbacterium sp. cf332]
MREILAVARDELAAGRPVAVATVVAASGSSPREIGASMLVSADGRAFGNVSAGCVDGAVYERCVEVLAGADATLDRFGIADDDAIAVGLSCGGTIDVLVRALAPGSSGAATLNLLAAREYDAVPTVLRLRTSGARIGSASIVESATDPAPSGCVDLAFGAPPRLVVVGAVEVAVALTALGSAAGFQVTVVDPRDVFARPDRFPGAHVVVDQPGRYLAAAALDAGTAVCVLTHDPKFDVPALAAALASPASYVGAMGSRATCADRIRRLAEQGVAPAALARLRSPIGLDLGGSSAAEAALSILGEIVAVRRGGTGRPLRGESGPIRRATAPAPLGCGVDHLVT